mgnify:CR=1 FL=1
MKLYETKKRTPPKERLHIRTPPSKKKKFSQLASTETKVTSSQFCDIRVQTDITIISIMEQANFQSDVSAADLMAHNIKLVEKEVVVPLCNKIVELEKKNRQLYSSWIKLKRNAINTNNINLPWIASRMTVLLYCFTLASRIMRHL